RVEVKVKYADSTEAQCSVEVRPFVHVKVPLSQPPVDAPAVVLTESADPMLWAEFSPDGRQIVTASEKGAVVLWDMKAGRAVRSFTGHAAGVFTVMFSADGERLLTASGDQLAMLWNVRTGKVIRRFKAHTAPVTAAVFSADEKKIVTASADKTAILWDAETGAQLRTFSGHTDEVVAVAISPDGKLVATGSTDKTLIVWNAENGEKPFNFRTQDTVSGLEFTPDGNYLGSSNFSNVATIYEVATGKILGGTRRNNLDLNAIGFTPDGRRFYTAGKDAVARLWDTATREMVREFNGHGSDIHSVRPSRDGTMLLTASRDGTVRLFDNATGMELACLASSNGGKNWAVVAPDGLYDGSELGRRMIGYRFSTKLPGASVDQFFAQFYRPGLLAEIFRGDRPMAATQMGRRQPPALKIVAPKIRSTTEEQIVVVVDAVDQGGGVAAPQIFNNGARVAVEPETKREGDTVRYAFKLNLAAGSNQIRVTAASEDGSWEAIPAETELSSSHRPNRKGRLFVVAVGVSDYAESKLNLKPAAGDARALVELLQRRSATLYDRVDVVPLIGSEATRARIKETLLDVASLSQPQDTVMLLVCGRGALLGDRLIIAPSELRLSAASWENDFRTQGLDGDELAALLGTAKALNRILVLDASDAAPTRAGEKQKPSDFALRAAVERWSRAQGVYAIAACAPAAAGPAGETSHGLLAGLLLDSAGGSNAGTSPSATAGDRSSAIGVMDWFNMAAERAGPLLERLGLDPLVLQQSSKPKSFPLLAAAK
ncbi:MAG: caspase family protein, partial [Opitutaceae bacterium]